MKVNNVRTFRAVNIPANSAVAIQHMGLRGLVPSGMLLSWRSAPPHEGLIRIIYSYLYDDEGLDRVYFRSDKGYLSAFGLENDDPYTVGNLSPISIVYVIRKLVLNLPVRVDERFVERGNHG